MNIWSQELIKEVNKIHKEITDMPIAHKCINGQVWGEKAGCKKCNKIYEVMNLGNKQYAISEYLGADNKVIAIGTDCEAIHEIVDKLNN